MLEVWREITAEHNGKIYQGFIQIHRWYGDSSNTTRDQDRLCRRSCSRAISEEFAPRIGTRGASLNLRSAQTGEGLSTSRHSTCTDKYPLLWGKADIGSVCRLVRFLVV